MALFRLTQPHFIEPTLYKAGAVIDYDGPCTPGMEALDEDAQKRLDAYYTKNPKATIRPVDDLSRVVAREVAPPAVAPVVPQVSAPASAKEVKNGTAS